MAYDIENLVSLGGNGKRGVIPNVYMYYNSANDTVTTADYFNNIALAVGDQIMVVNAAYTAQVWYRVSAVSAGKATVTALA